MAPTPPLPEPLWKTASPELQAAVLVLVQSYEDRIAFLESRLNNLDNRLKLNSTNSSKPPWSDPIGLKRKPPAPRSGKNRGAQHGHRKAHRSLVPPEKLRETIKCKPRHFVAVVVLNSLVTILNQIHQIAELPKIEPIVDEYRLHRLTCPACRATTYGALPPGIPTGGFGPYLGARRNSAMSLVPEADEPVASSGQASSSGGGAVPLREDGGDVFRDPQGGGGFVDGRAAQRG